MIISFQAFSDFWTDLLNQGRRVVCGEHQNFPGGCFSLHYPNSERGG